MDDEYDSLKKSSLKFKGEKRKKRRKKFDSSQLAPTDAQAPDERSDDAEDHGGWWKVTKSEHIKDDVAIEFLPGYYAKAMSNGSIALGQPHPPGEGPEEEEIFTAIPCFSNQIALKSGFSRYLSIDQGRLIGLSEAIGEKEAFLPVFEDGKMALCAFNNLFLSVEYSEGEDVRPILAKSAQVGSNELLTIRTNHDPLMGSKRLENKDDAHEDPGKLYETELNYLKKYQGKGEIASSSRDIHHLKRARVEGHLHEALLDKREKHKSDKYCK